MYIIQARVITERGKWTSSVGVATFYVAAINAEHAAQIAHNIITAMHDPKADAVKVTTAGTAYLIDPNAEVNNPAHYHSWVDKKVER